MKSGGAAPFIIGGPCTIDPDNPSLYLETAHALKEAGVNALRGGVWKPRTNPYSYQGDIKALEIILQARDETKLPIDIEVMDVEQLKIASDAKVDVLQIGTRNALNYSLLKEVGSITAGSQVSVLLKRGRHMAPPNEFIAAAEYLIAAGNPNILLCPRGTTPVLDGYRNHPDESITPLLKNRTWAPVIVDPSHSVGHADFVKACSLASIAYGADGLCIESHIEPSKGIGDDPKQAITPTSNEGINRCMSGGVAKQISGKFLGTKPGGLFEGIAGHSHQLLFKRKEWEVEAAETKFFNVGFGEILVLSREEFQAFPKIHIWGLVEGFKNRVT